MSPKHHPVTLQGGTHLPVNERSEARLASPSFALHRARRDGDLDRLLVWFFAGRPVKDAVVVPTGTCTLGGTPATTGSLLERLTSTPPEGAVRWIRTVPFHDEPLLTSRGVNSEAQQVNLWRRGVLSCPLTRTGGRRRGLAADRDDGMIGLDRLA